MTALTAAHPSRLTPRERLNLRDSLAAQGYNVLCASSGQEALALAAEHPGKIDLLITDTIMPEMDGPKLARSLRETRPETKVFYISGYTEDASLFGSGLLRSEAFFQKPFPLDSLAQKVRALISDQGASIANFWRAGAGPGHEIIPSQGRCN